MLKSYGRWWVSAIVAAGFVGGARSEAISDFTADYADTPIEVNVAAGVTNNLSGVISGTSSIVKTGAGCLKISNGANTFSGGVTISSGVVEMTANGALGTGKISIAGSTTGDCQLFVNTPDAVIYNDIAQTSSSYSGSANCQPHPMLKTAYSTVFNGNFTAVRRWEMADTGKHVTNIVNGTISLGSCTFGAQVHGVLRVLGPYSFFETSFTYSGDSSLKGGVVEFATPASATRDSAGFFSSWIGVRVGGDNCFGPKFYMDWSVPQSDDGAGFYDLNGHDVAVRMLDWFPGSPFAAGSEGCRIYSDEPCTLTIGTSIAPSKLSYRTFARLDGPMNLLMDGNFTQIFSNRHHRITGNLMVSNGTLRVAGTGRFANVPKVVVAEGGTLDLDSSAVLAFESAGKVEVDGTLAIAAGMSTPFTIGVELALGANARLVLPEGYRLVVSSVTTGGVRVASSELPELPQIEGGSVYYNEEVTWTGGGSTPAITDMGNWKSVFPASALQTGALTAQFAESGNRVELAAPVAFNTVELNSANNFTFAATDASASFACAGISLAGTALVYAFDVPFEFTDRQSLSIPSGMALAFRRGLSSASMIQKSGAGKLYLTGEQVLPGGMSQSGGSVYLSGTLSSGDPAADATRAATQDGAGVYTIYSEGNGGGKELTVSNATVRLPIRLVPTAEAESIWSPTGATNLIAGKVLGNNSKSQRFFASRLSSIEFSNQVSVNWTLWLSGSGTGTAMGQVRFTNNGDNGNNRFDLIKMNGTVVEFDCTKCTFTDSISFEKASELIFHRSDMLSFSSGKGLLLQPYGTGTTPQGNCWVSFNTTSQRVDILKCTSGITTSGIRGNAGSVLEIAGSAACEYRAMINGAISILKTGTGALTLSGRAFETTGELTARNGTISFVSDATWRNGSKVTVEGSGKIVLSRGDTFGTDAVLSLSGGGTLEIPENACQTVRELWIDGKLMPSGTYGGTESPAANRRACFTGKGMVRARHLGSTIVFR